METMIRSYEMPAADIQSESEFLNGLFDKNGVRTTAPKDGSEALNYCQCGAVGWFRNSLAYKQEILDCLNDAECDLMDARREFPAKWRFGLASTAAWNLCKIYLYASGYNADNRPHLEAIQALPLIFGENRKADTDYLKACLMLRNRKNSGQYPAITSRHADKLIQLVEDLYLQTREWLYHSEPDPVESSAMVESRDTASEKVPEEGMSCLSHEPTRLD